MLKSVHLGPELEPRIHQSLRKGFQGSPSPCKIIPFFSGLLNAAKAPSETLDNLLRTKNEFVARKRISVFMEADRISKEAPAGARVKSWEMTTSGSKIPAWRMGRGIIDVGKPRHWATR